MAKNLWIEAESFTGNTIFGSTVPPYGWGLENVQDINTGKCYTIIQKGDKWYSYEEREDGSVVFNH